MRGSVVQSDDKECPWVSRLILRDYSFGSDTKSLHLRRGSAGYRAVCFDGGAFHFILLVYSIDCSHGRCALERSFVGFFASSLFDMFVSSFIYRAPFFIDHSTAMDCLRAGPRACRVLALAQLSSTDGPRPPTLGCDVAVASASPACRR
jgi:hypothetical protein